MLTRSMGAGFTGKVRPERVFDMQVERETGPRDLRLRKVILRSCLMARWSEMERSVLETMWVWSQWSKPGLRCAQGCGWEG
jgi:hypothetical protein